MQADDCLEDFATRPVRWIPSGLLDLPPLEPVFALRTPHRIYLQAMPSSRETLRVLLQNQPFEISIDVEGDGAPLRHVPVQDVHEARLAPDLCLPWSHYYWIADGLQSDLVGATQSPGTALAHGRHRLAVVEDTLRAQRRGVPCELGRLQEAWRQAEEAPRTFGVENGDSAQQYVQNLTAHLVAHTSSRAFADWMADLAREGARRRHHTCPTLSPLECQLLGNYLQHRALGNVALVSPAGMIAGWQLLVSTALLAAWYAGLLVHAAYEHDLDEALVASLWMLDQGFWCDESLVHETLRLVQSRGLLESNLALSLTHALVEATTRV